MTDARPVIKVKDRVSIIGCPVHGGMVGEVIDCYGEPPRRTFRIQLADGKRCWPLGAELVEEDDKG